MKTLAELQAIRERMKDNVTMRSGSGSIRAVVGMATCGIAAGARPVLNAFVEGISEAGLGDKVQVTQTGSAECPAHRRLSCQPPQGGQGQPSFLALASRPCSV